MSFSEGRHHRFSETWQVEVCVPVPVMKASWKAAE